MDATSYAALTTFLTTTPADQLLLNGAASYAFLLLENGRGWFTNKHLGKPAQRALNDAAQIAFAALVAEARKSYPHNCEAHEEAVRAALALLLAHPSVTRAHEQLGASWCHVIDARIWHGCDDLLRRRGRRDRCDHGLSTRSACAGGEITYIGGSGGWIVPTRALVTSK